MGNKKALKFYDKLSKNFTKPTDLRNKSIDTTTIDVNFIRQYVDDTTLLLDIGSGPGLIVNQLKQYVKKIVAIEMYQEFIKLISPDIQTVQEDILELDLEQFSFSIVTIFGTMHYFNEDESKKIYQKIYQNLPKNGLLIIKNQFGVKDNVTVTYSQELESEYFAEYRYVEKEILNLKKLGFKLLEQVDIYPEEYNRWENTHFYTLVLKKG